MTQPLKSPLRNPTRAADRTVRGRSERELCHGREATLEAFRFLLRTTNKSERRSDLGRHGQMIADGMWPGGGCVVDPAARLWRLNGLGVERVGPGAVVFINPEVIHTGVALTGGWRYRVLYPGSAVMTEIGGGRGMPFFPNRISYDDRAARLMVSMASCAGWLTSSISRRVRVVW